MRVHPTVTASTMIARFKLRRKVRCHRAAVENSKGAQLQAGAYRLIEMLRACARVFATS